MKPEDIDETLDSFLKMIADLADPEPGQKPTSIKEQPKKKQEFHGDSLGAAVLARARADLGVTEDLGHNDGKRIREYFKTFHTATGQEWCAAAVCTWMKEAGVEVIPGSLGAREVARQFASAGRWAPKGKITEEVLVPGNIAVWARGGSGSGLGHIGVINSISGDSFTSIEGNSGPKGDRVTENTHNINDANFLGIGIL